jgi:Lsr2.
MAQKVIRELVCDITGAPAEETVQFAVGNDVYEIDLASEPLADFRSALGGFIESGRKVGKLNVAGNGHKTRTAASGGGSGRGKEQLAAARAWLRQQGYSVQDRGRIAADLMAKFDAAHQPSGTEQAPAQPAVEPHRAWA